MNLALVAAFVVVSCSSLILTPSALCQSTSSDPDTASFTIAGDIEVSVEDATSFVSEITRIKIWKLTLRSPPSYKAENGRNIIVSLFFSRNFEPKPGAYPVQFSYLNAENAMGGSVVVLGNGVDMYSIDTEGEITFEVFDERLTGSFHFVSYNGSDEDRHEVSVKGTFDCARGNALNVVAAE